MVQDRTRLAQGERRYLPKNACCRNDATGHVPMQQHNALSRKCDATMRVNDGDKSASDKKAASHIERRCSPDGCRREVREQLLDCWGHSRPLYRRVYTSQLPAFT